MPRALSSIAFATALMPAAAFAGFSFPSIDGGTIDLDAFRGQPVLVVNTASLCGFAGQFDDLQTLHDQYADRGLVVLAVPSDDFRQELADAEKFEIAVLGAYLPEKMGADEMAAAVAAAVAQTGAKGPADMGKLMAVLKPQLAGKADMAEVSKLVKAALAS